MGLLESRNPLETRVDSENNHRFVFKRHRYDEKLTMFQQKPSLVSVGCFPSNTREEHAVPTVASPHM
jgi:hypothetical protein